MKPKRLTRREILLKSAALGSLSMIPTLSFDEALWAWQQSEQKLRKPTAWDEIGPFYKREAPQSAQLRRPGDAGLPVRVSGIVFDTKGNVVSGAKIEIWQANHEGIYDLDGYGYRATLVANVAGKYEFGCVMPGHYPGRVCQHIHYLVSAPGHKPLTTQLYFATDPVFEGDPEHNYTRDPLIQSVSVLQTFPTTRFLDRAWFGPHRATPFEEKPLPVLAHRGISYHLRDAAATMVKVQDAGRLSDEAVRGDSEQQLRVVPLQHAMMDVMPSHGQGFGGSCYRKLLPEHFRFRCKNQHRQMLSRSG